jgi:hypothetical protein
MRGFKKAVYVLVLVAGCMLIGMEISSAFMKPQATGSPQSTAQAEKDREDRGPEPVVDIDKPPTDLTPPSIRNERNRGHNVNSGHSLQEPAAGEEEEAGFSSPQHPRAALPVKQSDLIVIADVVKASAYLSEAKDMVYSEFQVRATQVLMNNASPLQIGDTLDAERIGGAVRFPSGRIWRFRIFDQGLPKVGGRYLFFLKSTPVTANFDLVTGYLLENGKVQPLDGIGFHHNPSAAHPATKYKGATETTLINDIKLAIQNGGAQ